MSLDNVARRIGALVTRRCSANHGDHQILDPDADARALLGLAEGEVLHVDRERKPRYGDLVWVQLVQRGSTVRLVRQYRESDGLVTLSVPGDVRPAIVRRPYEMRVLGVVHPTSDATCRVQRP